MAKQEIPANRRGYVAIVGKPNVGKSTLLNHLVGQKISITSRKPQTTRHRILGILTEEQTQIVFVDTPGIHLDEKRILNRYMNRAAGSSLQDVDVILVLVDGTSWNEDDANSHSHGSKRNYIFFLLLHGYNVFRVLVKARTVKSQRISNPM